MSLQVARAMAGWPVARWLTAAMAGGLFAAGLVVSGLTDPGNVLAFLDLGGGWRPYLALVMASAVGVYTLAFRWIVGAPARALAPLQLPTRRDLDRSLLGGAALFGVGWGLVGYCPGPAMVGGLASTSALVFVAAMLVGMVVQHRRAGAR